ncbi:MAG: ferritin-like domain-containing protein [Myxococcales bacterium]|nr:ferritin-like domain-containing protein [Myxococcales bacterium]MCB9750623.1 ferritin-like domain-containing protein [Myxococcales bacterium]
MPLLVDLPAARPIPYDLFARGRTELEARRARRMESIYHRGQDRIWDGREVLRALIEKHGEPRVEDERRRASLAYVLSIIMWGEYAAWRVSAELADRLYELEPRLAATSQSHDEARHFYVLHDYLLALGERPIAPDAWGRRLIELTLRTDNVSTKLLGMQLTIESIALSLFKALRDGAIEPVLSELLPYYERDEARHVGLGHQLLPTTFATGGRRSRLGAQLAQTWLTITALGELKELERHFETLGIDKFRIIDHAQDRMLSNLKELELAGSARARVDWVGGVSEGLIEALFPRRAGGGSLLARARGLAAAIHEGSMMSPEQRIQRRDPVQFEYTDRS